MVVGVAKLLFDHGQAFEVVAALVFHGHADAAMQLDGLLADEAGAAADLDLGGGDGGVAGGGVGLGGGEGGVDGHRAGLFEHDQHVDRAVLQGLEAADGDAELLAGFKVVGGELDQCVHRADGLGAEPGDGGVHAVGEERAGLRRRVPRMRVAGTRAWAKEISAAQLPSCVG